MKNDSAAPQNWESSDPLDLATQAAQAKKICLVSLGCPKNLVDAEMMLGFLQKDGFEFTTRPEESDVIVVNTCGFVEDSKTESIEHLLEMSRYKEDGNCQVLVASGCLPQRYSEELAHELPEVDMFVGTGEFDKISGLLKKRFDIKPSKNTKTSKKTKNNIFPKALISRDQILPDPDLPRVLATPKHYSYVKISEGCSHICSFCIIPDIRGKLISRPMESIVSEVEHYVAEGVKEFNLIAQDLNEYGRDLKNGSSLSILLQKLNKIPGDFWIRPHYMYPLEFNDRLINVMRDSEHILKYVDMPLQHISERVLRSMKRGSPSRYVRQVLTKLKNAMPDLAIRTTFIVGYPGETEEEFQELCNFIQEYQFDRVGVFKYSPEDGTSAALLEEQVEDEVKEDRYHRLMLLQQEISLNKNRALEGKIFRAICEGPSKERPRFYQGRIYSQSPDIDGVTYLSGTEPKIGEFVDVKILRGTEYDLFAQVLPV